MGDLKLHAYQERLVQRIIDTPALMLRLDCGMGKTATTLTAIERLRSDYAAIHRTLVVAPLFVAENTWPDEADKWGNGHLRVSVITGTEKKRMEAIRKDADVYVINRENINWLTLRCLEFLRGIDMLVIDESSSFKSSGSQRFRALRRVRPFFKRVLALTATPASGGYMDLWAQMYLLDRGDRLFPTIGKYRKEYFVPDKTNGHIVYSYRLRPGAEESIQRRISDIVVSLSANDYLSLPPVMEHVMRVKMPEELRSAYRTFKKDRVADMGGSPITALHAAGLSNKLQQFAAGALYADEGGEVVRIHGLKTEAVRQIVEDAEGENVLILYQYRFELAQLQEALHEFSPRTIEKPADVKEWNAGRIRCLLGHPASMGHGLNLQAGGRMIIWVSPTWSAELYIQAISRIYRQGQQRPVIIYHIVTEGTIDERIVTARKEKVDREQILLNAVKAEIGI